jgi:hypothetical protein
MVLAGTALKEEAAKRLIDGKFTSPMRWRCGWRR